MMIFSFRLLAFMSLLLCTLCVDAATVKNVRVWRASDYTRVVFDLNSSVEYSVTLSNNPARIIVDIPQSAFSGSLSQLSLADTSIQSVRSATVAKKNLRFIFDIKNTVTPKSFFLKKNGDSDDRLVVDLYDAAEPVKNVVKASASTAKTSTKITANTLQEPVDFEESVESKSSPATAKAIETNSSDNSTNSTASWRRPVLIVIDAGHGGEDAGALGPNNMREKDVTLAIAKELVREINSQPGFTAIQTRATDIYLPLQKRRDIARDKKADLFISVHADSFTDPTAYGASVFALSRKGATSEAARFLAQRENESDLIGRVGGVSLEDKDVVLAGVLVDLSMTATVNSSLQLGNNVLNSISTISPLHSKHVEQAGFVVLKSPDVPSILVETGFISNKNESKKLASSDYRSDMAQAIFRGVRQYFSQHPPAGVYAANTQSSTEKKVNERNSSGTSKNIIEENKSDNQSDVRKHLVVRGDTLADIAIQYHVSMNQIKKLNSLKNDTVKLGQTLKIPAQ